MENGWVGFLGVCEKLFKKVTTIWMWLLDWNLNIYIYSNLYIKIIRKHINFQIHVKKEIHYDNAISLNNFSIKNYANVK